MTGRTHDLAAFAALLTVCVFNPPEKISLATAIVALGSNMLGGLAPDVDQTSAEFWNKIRFGRILSRYIAPLFGKHRYLSHSIVGVLLFGIILKLLLGWLGGILLVDMNVVWWSFIIGFVSHLVMDSITKEGVPWFFPIPLRIGFPPVRILRIKTGGFLEKAIIFPGLVVGIGWVVWDKYDLLRSILTSLK